MPALVRAEGQRTGNDAEEGHAGGVPLKNLPGTSWGQRRTSCWIDGDGLDVGHTTSPATSRAPAVIASAAAIGRSERLVRARFPAPGAASADEGCTSGRVRGPRWRVRPPAAQLLAAAVRPLAAARARPSAAASLLRWLGFPRPFGRLWRQRLQAGRGPGRHRSAVVVDEPPEFGEDDRSDPFVAHAVEVAGPSSAPSRCAAIGLSMALRRCVGSDQLTFCAMTMRPSTSSCFFGRCCGISSTTVRTRSGTARRG